MYGETDFLIILCFKTCIRKFILETSKMGYTAVAAYAFTGVPYYVKHQNVNKNVLILLHNKSA